MRRAGWEKEEKLFLLPNVLPFYWKTGFFYRKIHFQVFWQKAEILYGKQMVCIEILYKQEPSLHLKGSVNSPQIWDEKLADG